MNDATFEEKLSIRLTRFNVFIVFGTLSILLVVATIYLIAFTPLREYIPGYADFNTREVLRELMLRTDTLERDLYRKDLFIHSIRQIVEGVEPDDIISPAILSLESFEIDELPKSREDSIIRAEVENMGNMGTWIYEAPRPSESIHHFFFFPPVKGILTNHFDPANGHFGVDIVADQNETIKATLDGTVIFSTWTINTGYTIGVQHNSNLVSVYKHNSAVLKQEGSFVRAGEVIAIIGETGLYSSGTHLHFELWYDGTPVNPIDYIVF